jgi:hypothetical protein
MQKIKEAVKSGALEYGSVASDSRLLQPRWKMIVLRYDVNRKAVAEPPHPK